MQVWRCPVCKREQTTDLHFESASCSNGGRHSTRQMTLVTTSETPKPQPVTAAPRGLPSKP